MRQSSTVNPSFATRPSIKPITWIDPSLRLTLEAEGTTAHRLASGTGGWVERLGNDVLISHKNDRSKDEMIDGLERWCTTNGWQPERVFTRFLALKNEERISPILLSGDPSLPLTTVVTEAGVRYGLDFGVGQSHGLALDQRVTRNKVRLLRPKRLLNTYAHTCSFSVVAALAGATTVNVDLSKKSLERGKQNFDLNGIFLEGHRFLTGDTLEILPQLENSGEKFDVIILDSPAFSRGTNRRWQVENDFEDLLLVALAVASPKCAILLSTNSTKLDPVSLEYRARRCAKEKRRTADYVMSNPPPDFPIGKGACTVWMMVR